MTDWSHLPNAAVIDRIIESVKTNTAVWGTTSSLAASNVPFNDILVAARDKAYRTVSGTARVTGLNAAWNAAWTAATMVAYAHGRDNLRSAAADVAHDAIVALVAWDDCAHLLDEKPDHVKTLALLGVQPAASLYLACVALDLLQLDIFNRQTYNVID